MRAFRITEVALGLNCREVRVEGELDLAVADQLRGRLDAAIRDNAEVLVCLEDCDFIDSTGIAVIVIAHEELAKRGRRLVMCNPSRPVSRALEITGLAREGLLYASTEAALADRSPNGVAKVESRDPATH